MSAEDWARDEQQLRAHRCEVRDGAIGHYVGEKCGRRARWWSSELVAGDDLWMCDDHCREIMMRTDAHIEEVES